ASTPAAPPDSTVATGSEAARAAVITSPAESITWTSHVMPMVRRRTASSSRYRDITGPTIADTTVVMARSYSRISGQTSDEHATNASGTPARSRLATDCS